MYFQVTQQTEYIHQIQAQQKIDANKVVSAEERAELAENVLAEEQIKVGCASSGRTILTQKRSKNSKT